MKTIREVVELLKKEKLVLEVLNLPQKRERELLAYPLTDSRKAEAAGKQQSGTITSFICIKGFATDGHHYIEQLVNQGIGLLILETPQINLDTIQIVVTDSRKALAIIAKLYFDDPSNKFYLIGVTGTNGKTSIVNIIESVFNKCGEKVGSIGTLGYTVNGVRHSLERTTPDITELNELLSLMVEEQVKYVVMEVSSHALKLDRVYGLSFDLGIFTNLTREHLDFHSDMNDYFESKDLLFQYLKKSNGIGLFNVDDPYPAESFRRFQGEKFSIGKGERTGSDVTYLIGHSDLVSTLIRLSLNDNLKERIATEVCSESEIMTSLPGEHNAFNLSAAIAALLLCSDIEFTRIVSSLPTTIKGRLERIENKAEISCFVDYAHTPDALSNSCRTLRSIIDNKATDKKRRLITIIGAGGNRDSGKRSEMTRAVLEYSDLAIITSDNPRKEKPSNIIIDMVSNLHPMSNYWIVTEREEAIKTAIEIANEGDTVLIAGKGHEETQDFADRKEVFSDHLTAAKYLALKHQRRAHSKASDSQIEHLSGTIETAIAIDELQLLVLLQGNSDTAAYLAIETTSNAIPISKEEQDRLLGLKNCSVSNQNRMFYYISTDTRTLKSPAIYFAIRGERYDGHDYVKQISNSQTDLAVVDSDFTVKDNQGSSVIQVDNTRIAYGLLARKFRTLFNPEVIAITGSVGKTSTKEYCYRILANFKPTLKNIANENNIIGVSRTLFRLNSHYRYLVMEIGSNHPGEIAQLADTVQPQYAVITNIKPSHLEFFGDLDGVFQEKSGLFKRRLKARFVPADEQRFEKFPYPLVKLSEKRGNQNELCSAECVYDIELLRIEHGETHFRLNGYDYSLATDIRFLLKNACFSVALASELNIPLEIIRKSLKLPLPLTDRMEISKSNERIVISDCYNANPTSMKAALEYWLDHHPELPHVAILGDMLELGEEAEVYHQEIGSYLAGMTAAKEKTGEIFTVSVGNLSQEYKCNIHFTEVESFFEANVVMQIPANAVVLLKASNSLHLERIKGRL